MSRLCPREAAPGAATQVSCTATVAENPNPHFRLERDLVDALCADSLDVLRNTPHNNFELLREVPVGAHATRFPDVVLIFSFEQPDTAQVRLTYEDAILLAALLKQSATSAELREQFFADVASLEQRLGGLSGKNLVRRSADGRWEANRSVLPSGIRIVAIEAKLARWRQALEQAGQYSVFANESYIAMPGHLACGRQLLTTCASRGVGVIAVDQHGVRVVLEAESHAPQTPEWLRFVTRTVGCIRPGRTQAAIRVPPSILADDRSLSAD
jgi:hypothetical protein